MLPLRGSLQCPCPALSLGSASNPPTHPPISLRDERNRDCVDVHSIPTTFVGVLATPQFLDLCLLVGCDYITASIKGLGITTAHKLVDSHRSLDKVRRQQQLYREASLFFRSFYRQWYMITTSRAALWVPDSLRVCIRSDDTPVELGHFQGPCCGIGTGWRCGLLDSNPFVDRRQIMHAVNSSKFVVPEGYWEQYKMARVTFRHHIIYNPATEVGCSLVGAIVHTTTQYLF